MKVAHVVSPIWGNWGQSILPWMGVISTGLGLIYSSMKVEFFRITKWLSQLIEAVTRGRWRHRGFRIPMELIWIWFCTAANLGCWSRTLFLDFRRDKWLNERYHDCHKELEFGCRSSVYAGLQLKKLGSMFHFNRFIKLQYVEVII